MQVESHYKKMQGNFKFKSKNNFISIIIPVYNDPKGLNTTLNSILNQKVNKKEYEIIVANDGGIERIANVCKKHQVNMVEIVPRRGSYAARNKGLSISKGEWILFVDSNVKLSKKYLKKGLDLLKKYDYFGGKVIIDPSELNSLADYYEFLCSFKIEKNLKKDHFIPTVNLFVKREVFESLGRFEDRLFSGGDVEFGNRVFDSKKFKMHYTEKIYVIHPPRGFQELTKKHIRTTRGSLELANLYPKRFGHLKFSLIKILKILVAPLVCIIRSNIKIGFFKKFKLIFWAIFFGSFNFYNTIKKCLLGGIPVIKIFNINI